MKKPHSMIRLGIATLLLFSGLSLTSTRAADAQPPLPTVALTIDDTTLTAEVASSGEQRYMGLSFRPTLADDAGMLFVYPGERQLMFTMRNTLIPLSIAFISEDLVVNEIHLMDVGPDQVFPSNKPAKYALEVNQGWFVKHGIKPGARIVMR